MKPAQKPAVAANKTGATTAPKQGGHAPAPANKPAANTAHKGAPAPANKGAPVQANKGAPVQANKGAPVQANKGAPVQANKGAPVQANKAPGQNPPHQVQKPPQIKVEEIKLAQLLEKIKQSRDNNRSLFIIDKLEANDSFTFFKYAGKTVDLSTYTLQEQMNKQPHEKSVEAARKLTVQSLRDGSTLVYFVDKMLTNLQEFFKDAPFFSFDELFVPQQAQQESYFRGKLLKPEEDVDGFGNKGGYNPHKDFIAIILSKSTEKSPEELFQHLGVSAKTFDVLIIS